MVLNNYQDKIKFQNMLYSISIVSNELPNQSQFSGAINSEIYETSISIIELNHLNFSYRQLQTETFQKEKNDTAYYFWHLSLALGSGAHTVHSIARQDTRGTKWESLFFQKAPFLIRVNKLLLRQLDSFGPWNHIKYLCQHQS